MQKLGEETCMVAQIDIRSATDQVQSMDPIWDALKTEARAAAEADPVLSTFLYSTILNHKTLEGSVIYRICERLDHPDVQAVLIRQAFIEMLDKWPEWASILR